MQIKFQIYCTQIVNGYWTVYVRTSDKVRWYQMFFSSKRKKLSLLIFFSFQRGYLQFEVCSNHFFVCSSMFKIGKCDDISCEHEGTDVIFDIQNLLTTRPDPSRYPNCFASTRPVLSQWNKPIPVRSWLWECTLICDERKKTKEQTGWKKKNCDKSWCRPKFCANRPFPKFPFTFLVNPQQTTN